LSSSVAASKRPWRKGRGNEHRDGKAYEPAEALTRKAVELALEGGTVALRLCLERLLPPRKSRRVAFDLPTIRTAADLLPAFAAVVSAMASGELAPDEAAVIAGVLEAKRKAIENGDLEKRLAALEQQRANNGNQP
jgi:hypothetical protein